MSISEQLNFLALSLIAWAERNKGRAFIAADALDAVDQLRATPGAPTLAILWTGRVPREPEHLGRRDNQFKLIVSRGRSLKLIPGESLSAGSAGGRPLFDLVEEAENLVLSLRLEEGESLGPDERMPVYQGTGQFEVAGLLLDAYEIRFTLAAQAPVQS